MEDVSLAFWTSPLRDAWFRVFRREGPPGLEAFKSPTPEAVLINVRHAPVAGPRAECSQGRTQKAGEASHLRAYVAP